MYHIGNAIVQYTNRQWQTTANNHTATFPRGEEGKQAAFANAVATQNYDLFQAVTHLTSKHPQLTGRAWNAAILATNGHVLPDDGLINHAVAIVTSQKNKKREYIIQWREVPVCSCDDYQYEKSPRIGKHQVKTCKHILAVMLLKNIGRFQIKITWNK